jgi:hypothetical protein
MSAAKDKGALALTLDFFASYGLATVLLLLMCLLTFLGTLEQVDHGLFEVQQKYFNSLFLVHWLGDVVPIPLPGVALLMGLLAINLTLGGLVRIRRSTQTAGVIVAHLGIMLLIAAGLVTYMASYEGSLALHKGEEGAHFTSYNQWELAVRPATTGEITEHAFPEAMFTSASAESPSTLTAEGLPFEIQVTEWFKNSDPVTANDAGGATVVDGFALKNLDLELEAEANIRGVYLRLVADGVETPAIVWGGSQHPWLVNVGGETWVVALRRERYPLPFTVRLTDFVHEQHPGTSMARNYESTVLRMQDGEQEEVHIKMNEPLRSGGFTLFQARVQMDRDGVISVFAVVKNPADKWPEWACYIIALGLSFHFSLKLVRYVKAQQAKRAAA